MSVTFYATNHFWHHYPFTRIRKKWTQPVQNWGQTAQQLAILFPDRFRILA